MLTPVETVFILTTFALVAILLLLIKNVNWKKHGLKPEPVLAGWRYILVFNVFVFVSVQLSDQFIAFPGWITDQDPFFGLLAIVAAQEVIFRSLLLTWLERWGQQRALWITTVVFAGIHLVFPSHWIITGLSLVGGYFWGWHFLKFRNLYWVIISHLLVNLSFNYLIF